MIAVADTGFVLAIANTADTRHTECLPIYQKCRSIYLPQTTLAEVAYLLTRFGGNTVTAHFLANLAKTKYTLIALEGDDITRTSELLSQYADTRVDFVDVTVAVIAERLDIREILTIDQRDFRILQLRHCDYLEIFP